jgi:AcrR family transcriptional regulator
VPRRPDPGLERRILDAALRLWARGGEKALTMRGIAKAAGTTTPTVYERYRNREDILVALRMEARRELLAALRKTSTLRQAVEHYLRFALEHSYAYEVLFDSVGRPPSLHEPWPSFNLIRERVARQIGGTPREHTRLMLSLWSLMHGTAMLIIRGRFEGALRSQTLYACLDAFDAIVEAARSKKIGKSGSAFPASLILGEGAKSRTGNGTDGTRRAKPTKHKH